MHPCRVMNGRWPSFAPPPPARLFGSNTLRVLKPRTLALGASSSPDDATASSSAQLRQPFTVKQLQQQMADAVESQDFTTAATLRDQLQTLDIPKPEDVLRLQLTTAIAAERFAVRFTKMKFATCPI